MASGTLERCHNNVFQLYLSDNSHHVHPWKYLQTLSACCFRHWSSERVNFLHVMPEILWVHLARQA